VKYQPPYGVGDSNAPYVNGDPSIARQGSILPAAAAEYPQREIVNFIGSSNIIPDDNDLYQLTRSSRSQWVNFCVDTGSINALSVALVPALQAYKQGTPLRVLVANSNTGPCTINVNGLGNRPVVRSNGAQLQQDDLRAGMIALIVDDGTRFQMMNFLGAIGGTVNNYNIHIPYAEDTSTTANAVVAAYSPAITAVAAGDLVLVKVKNTNLGPMTFAPNAMAAMPIKRNDSQPLQGGDVLANECILIEYNTTFWQMLRLVKSQVYFKLTADLTLWVRTDGDDTHDGSLNDAAHAFKTIQAAVDYIKHNFLIAGRTVTIALGIPGTYHGQIRIDNIPGTLYIAGSNANRNSYVIQGPSISEVSYPSVMLISGSVTVSIIGVMISNIDTTHNIIECSYGAYLALQDVSFNGNPHSGGCVASWGGHITMNNYIDVYNNIGGFANLNQGASLTIGLWFSLITMHGINMTGAFVICTGNATAFIGYGWCGFAGGAYGYHYLGYYNSAIFTGGGGEWYFPGSQVGGLDASSVYG
jgi:hypothetical protein